MKDYFNWHILKNLVDLREKVPFFHTREIWWCSMGLNVGNEQDGKGQYYSRPILILKKFNSRVLIGLPLSSKIKKANKYYKTILTNDGKIRSVIIFQIRLLDAKRLQEKIGYLDMLQFQEIKKSVIRMF